jgi:hypothetical protein
MKFKKYMTKMLLTFVSSSMLISSSLNASMDSLLEIPMTIFTVVWATACVTLLVPFYVASFVYDGDRNVTKDKRFSHILYRTFVLKEDMIYHQHCQANQVDLKKVGHLYKDWGIEEYKANLVTLGTRVTIYKIFEHKGIGLLQGGGIKVIGVIEDGIFSGYMVDLGEFLTDDRVDGKKIREMDSSLLEILEV